MKISTSLAIATIFTSVGLTPLTAQEYDKILKELDTYANNAVKQWRVPGLSITVVKDGQSVFTKSYGVRTLGKPEKVNNQTMFLCASTTKAFTATAIAMLVDDGKLNWDDRVINHMPEFQLYDPYVTRELTVRDLLTHRAGLGNADFLWGLLDIPSEEILYRVRYLKPSYSLRSGYTYQNIMFLAAGILIEKVSGKSWADFLKERIYQPLGMTSTVAYKKQTDGITNIVSPHYIIDDKIEVIEQTNADLIGPAGSMWSNVDDMSKWLKFLLDSAKINDNRLLETGTYSEMFKPQTIIPKNQFYPTASLTKPKWTTYGLGWFQHDYKGKAVDFHTGSLAGMVAIAGLIREENLGVYIMGNLDHAEVRHALMYKVFDLFLGEPSRDWSNEFLELYAGFEKETEAKQKEFEDNRVLNTNPSFKLDNYTGSYSDPLYGEIEITLINNKLRLSFTEENYLELEHWHFDTFRGQWPKRWYGKTNATFSLDGDGKIEKLNIMGLIYSKIKSE